MIYFSEIKGKKVITEDNIEIGNLDDIIFRASEKPLVTKITVRTNFKDKLIIPISYLRRINNYIIVGKQYLTSNLVENELYLVKNLLDKQIIDLKGNKIVRVNDVALQEKEEFYIIGVDIGILGVLRWIGIENIIHKLLYRLFRIQLSSQFLSWADIQPLELVRGAVKLKKSEERLEKVRPEDLADYLETTNVKNVRKFLTILGEKKAANVITNLNVNYQASLFRQFGLEKAAKIISIIDPDEAVDILLTVPAKKREEIIKLVQENKKIKIQHLLSHAESAIGEVMRSDFLTVSSDDTVSSVINKIQIETSDYYYFNVVYVINKEGQLIGLFNLHELLLQKKDSSVYKFMVQHVIVVHLTTPKEIALKRILKYNLYSLPVIDNNKHILGIVTLDDLLNYKKSY